MTNVCGYIDFQDCIGKSFLLTCSKLSFQNIKNEECSNQMIIESVDLGNVSSELINSQLYDYLMRVPKKGIATLCIDRKNEKKKYYKVPAGVLQENLKIANSHDLTFDILGGLTFRKVPELMNFIESLSNLNTQCDSSVLITIRMCPPNNPRKCGTGRGGCPQLDNF